MTTDHPTRHPSRRAVLRGGAAVGASSLAALVVVKGLAESAVAAVPTASANAALATSTGCATITKEETEGPFWVDEKLDRSDVRTDTEGSTGTQGGVPLTLTIKLQDAGASCTPQTGAYVDIWQAGDQGTYSDVSGSGNPDNRGQNWLRGYQVSDADGSVTFTTVMPGWYPSRTIHIHFRVRLSLDSSTTVNFTSQLFFDDTINDAVQDTTGYKGSAGRDTRNSTDDIFDSSLIVPLTGSTSAGYTGSFTVNLDFGDGSGSTTTPTPDTVVDASVGHLAVVRGRAGRRTLRVPLNDQERVVAKIRLLHHDTVLAHRTTGWMPVGQRTVSVPISRSVKAGRYQVRVNLADEAGNTKVVTRTVSVPS